MAKIISYPRNLISNFSQAAGCAFDILPAIQTTGAPLDDRVLASMEFGKGIAAVSDDRRVIATHLERLDGGSCADLWISRSPVVCGSERSVHYAANDDVVFGWTRVIDADTHRLERDTYDVYTCICELLARLGYPVWLRTWNYLERINEGDGDDERYRLFVKGRFDALSRMPSFESALPAATAVGTDAGGLLVCFLASRHRAVQIENPRQVSAFRYPRDYGPRSPSFSRATLQRWGDGSLLLISGTASVVGHRTLHAGNAHAQIEEVAANIEALLERSALEHFDSGPEGFVPLSFKVYARTALDYQAVRDELALRFPAPASIMVLKGEICRKDLAVEVEAIYRWQPAPVNGAA